MIHTAKHPSGRSHTDHRNAIHLRFVRRGLVAPLSLVSPGLAAWLALLFWAGSLWAGSPELVSLKKIWDRGQYHAFTDLTRFGDQWFCVFREAEQHARDVGAVRVLVSADGDSWSSAALLTDPIIDLRDPKISVTPDNRLMLLIGGTVYTDDKQRAGMERHSLVSFSSDGRDWTPRKQVLPDGHWLWRVTWHRGVAYGASKLGDGQIPKRGFLWRSRDGLDYELVHKFNVPGMSETTVRFADDDEMLALVRRTGPGGGNGWIGASRPPYDDWAWKETDGPFGGPNFIILPDGRIWATSRLYDPVDPNRRRTVLFAMTPQSLEKALTLPSGGDTSYAGMVWRQNLLWISYYSSHESRPSIYLAKIRFTQ